MGGDGELIPTQTALANNAGVQSGFGGGMIVVPLQREGVTHGREQGKYSDPTSYYAYFTGYRFQEGTGNYVYPATFTAPAEFTIYGYGSGGNIIEVAKGTKSITVALSGRPYVILEPASNSVNTPIISVVYYPAGQNPPGFEHQGNDVWVHKTTNVRIQVIRYPVPEEIGDLIIK